MNQKLITIIPLILNLKQRVATFVNGSFVIVKDKFEGDSSGQGVTIKKYNEKAELIIDEILVNTNQSDDQHGSAVEILDSGDVVVVWQSENQDTSLNGIQAQIFTSDLVKKGSEFRVNTYITDEQAQPAICKITIGGGFIVTWSSLQQDGEKWGVFAQMQNRIGNKNGLEIQANTTTLNSQMFSSVAQLDNDLFIIVWQSQWQDQDSQGIVGQIFNKDGSKFSNKGEFLVNTQTTNQQIAPTVIPLSPEGFLVAWESNGQDGNGDGVQAQRFVGSNGNYRKVTKTVQDDPNDPSTIHEENDEFQVNSYSIDNQQSPSAALLSDGKFVIVWETQLSLDKANQGVKSQMYNRDGTKFGGERSITVEGGWQQLRGIKSFKQGGQIIAYEDDNDGLSKFKRQNNSGTLINVGTDIIPNFTPSSMDFTITIRGDQLINFSPFIHDVEDIDSILKIHISSLPLMGILVDKENAEVGLESKTYGVYELKQIPDSLDNDFTDSMRQRVSDRKDSLSQDSMITIEYSVTTQNHLITLIFIQIFI